jgi:hypothetical protein
MATPNPATTEWVPIWQPAGVIAGGGSGGGGPHHITHETGGTDAVVNLSGGVITSGTVVDARLSSNVVLADKQNTFVASPQSIVAPVPLWLFNDLAAGVNNRVTRIFGGSNNFYVQHVADDLNTQQTFWEFRRSDGAFTSPGGLGGTPLNASNLVVGIVATPRLGSGVANSNTFLRGDQTWQPIPGSLPSGLIAMFASNCPPGWTRVSGMDGRFPRGATSFGATGGSATHSHDVSGSTGQAGAHLHSFSGSGSFSGDTGVVNNATPIGVNRSGPDAMLFLPHSHPFSGSVSISGDTSGVGDHTHPLNMNRTDDAPNLPPYVDVVYCMKD